jgi:hypothetical protein
MLETAKFIWNKISERSALAGYGVLIFVYFLQKFPAFLINL